MLNIWECQQIALSPKHTLSDVTKTKKELCYYKQVDLVKVMTGYFCSYSIFVEITCQIEEPVAQSKIPYMDYSMG